MDTEDGEQGVASMSDSLLDAAKSTDVIALNRVRETSTPYFFKKKRILVTGGAKGIGRGIAVKLAELNAEVFILDNSAQDLNKLNEYADYWGHSNIRTERVDLSDWNATSKVVGSLLPIDLLVNNVGTVNHQNFLDITPDAFDRAISIDVKSALNISQIVAKSLMETGYGGAIVNISSLASVAGDRGMGCYSAAKAALDSITRNMALELGPHNIRVNSVQPTFIATEGTKPLADIPAKKTYLKSIPLGGKMGEIEDVVDAVVFLLSGQSQYISGVHLRIDGAQYSHI